MNTYDDNLQQYKVHCFLIIQYYSYIAIYDFLKIHQRFNMRVKQAKTLAAHLVPGQDLLLEGVGSMRLSLCQRPILPCLFQVPKGSLAGTTQLLAWSWDKQFGQRAKNQGP